MKIKYYLINMVILILALSVISTICIVINGSTYTVRTNINTQTNSIDDIDIVIEQEKEIVKCVDKKIEDGFLTMKFESANAGKAIVDIKEPSKDYYSSFQLYVHKNGLITYNNYLGDFNGGIIVNISFLIILLYILFGFIKSFKQSMSESVYQYKNITFLGFIIFFGFSFIIRAFNIFNNKGLIITIGDVIGLYSFFSIFLLPVAFIVSILVTISNAILVKKEGFTLKNMLGVFLGILLCFLTMLPEILYNMLYGVTWIDIHNEQGIAMYIQTFVETSIYMLVSYLECIMLGTIILAVKSARHIPKYDKDFIIILGCQIKKDGSLTKLLKGRVDRAIEFRNMQKEKTGKDLIFVPSGGQGKDEVMPEAQAMKNYLMANGIDEKNIIIEDKSKNTNENIKFSNEIIKNKMKDAKVAFSTTNYHVYRAGAIANEQNIEMEGIGAKTRSYFWVNAFIREFIATLYSERKKHFALICAMTVVVSIMIVVLYFSNLS